MFKSLFYLLKTMATQLTKKRTINFRPATFLTWPLGRQAICLALFLALAFLVSGSSLTLAQAGLSRTFLTNQAAVRQAAISQLAISQATVSQLAVSQAAVSQLAVSQAAATSSGLVSYQGETGGNNQCVTACQAGQVKLEAEKNKNRARLESFATLKEANETAIRDCLGTILGADFPIMGFPGWPDLSKTLNALCRTNIGSWPNIDYSLPQLILKEAAR